MTVLIFGQRLRSVVDRHHCHILIKFCAFVDENLDKLPTL